MRRNREDPGADPMSTPNTLHPDHPRNKVEESDESEVSGEVVAGVDEAINHVRKSALRYGVQ